jgi:DNA polymerase III epsilon subunit-like protein
MYLIIDTETTGLPQTRGFDKWYSPEKHEYYDSARLVQIAWKMLDENFEEVLSHNFIVKRDGFTIENSQFHGVTNEMTDSQGVPLDTIFETLYTILLECNYIIAHNLAFDEHVILNHTYRIGDDHLRNRWMGMERVCTMKCTHDVLKLPKKNGYSGYKYPSLKELHYYYFNESFDGAHDAMNDVNACARCFVEYWKNKS